MKIISLDQFCSDVDQYLADTANGDVLVTHDGKPWVVLRNVVDDQDSDPIVQSRSTENWNMIQERRREEGISWDEAKQNLDLG